MESYSGDSDEYSDDGALALSLGLPNRDGLYFHFSNKNPNDLPLLTIEFRIPVKTTGIKTKTVGHIIRQHTVAYDPAADTIIPNKGRGFRYSHSDIIPESGVVLPGRDGIRFVQNDTSSHGAMCVRQTLLKKATRGTCICDLQHRFQKNEIAEAYEDARLNIRVNLKRPEKPLSTAATSTDRVVVASN